MSDVAQNLIHLLKNDTGVNKWCSYRIREDHVPQLKGDATEPFIWLGVRQTTDHGTLGDSVGAAADEHLFDLECVAGKQYDAKQLAAAVRTKLNNYRGTMNDQTAKGIFVRDQDNDYVPHATAGDEGVFVMAFDIQVWV